MDHSYYDFNFNKISGILNIKGIYEKQNITYLEILGLGESLRKEVSLLANMMDQSTKLWIP